MDIREHLLQKECFLSGIARITSTPPCPQFGQVVQLFLMMGVIIVIIILLLSMILVLKITKKYTHNTIRDVAKKIGKMWEF